MASALACTTIAVLPLALFGGLAPLIRGELGFSIGWIGLGVSLFFVTSAGTSVHGGRLADAVGSRRGLWVGLAFSAVALTGIGLLGRNLAVVLGFLALAGVGNGLIQPAANLALARGVRPGRRGLAFGVKQSAIPVATALGGFALPAIGLTLGWRPAFLAAAMLACGAALLPRATHDASARGALRSNGLRPVPRSLLLLSAAIAFGAAAGTAFGAYLVESSIASGWDSAQAGIVLGVGGVIGVMARITAGWWSDRVMDIFRMVLVMAVAGGIGLALLVYSHVPALLAIGVVLGFAAGWGYNGLFVYGVVRLHPEAPAAATGVTHVGSYVGPTLGPPMFGVVASTWSYDAAWIMLGVLSLLAAVLVQLARRQVARERAAG